MGEIVSVALLGLTVVTMSAAVLAKGRRDRRGLARSGAAAMEVDALFAPGRRRQLEQQRVVELVRHDHLHGAAGPSLLELDGDSVRLRAR